MLHKAFTHLRFFKLFGRIGGLSIPFLGFFAIIHLPIYFCIDMCPHHNNSEAINILNTVNGSQRYYFLNSSVFANSFEDLNTGVKSETKYYSYKILQTTPQATYAYALAKDKKLYSYINAVFVTKDFQNQEITTAVVCGLDKQNFSNYRRYFMNFGRVITYPQDSDQPLRCWQLCVIATDESSTLG